MGGIDLKAVLAAGAYGAGLLFFAYGAYVLVNAKSGQQGVNVRWFLGIGAVVFLALVGLDLARLLHEKEKIAPKVFLSFAPTSSEVGLPEPRVTYNGVQRPPGSAIEISDASLLHNARHLSLLFFINCFFNFFKILYRDSVFYIT